ncbi:MAG: glycosyltransferase [Gemmatimonadales bacterium]|nr:glycosyltransferase [Gemmatimonadales bacterium]
MTAPLPVSSIVVATRDRPGQLRTCLESLARLDYPRDRLEVIVVDDGGATPLEAVATPLRDVLDLRLLRQAWAGPAAARNLGAASARGELLAFTDDDCAPRPDWLARLAARHRVRPEIAVGGRTVNALTGNPYSTAAQMIIDAGYVQRNYPSSPLPFFTTNNLAVPAEGFRLLGGFNCSFFTAEDREFCARWAEHGRSVEYEPNAVVDHRHPLTFWRFCRLYFGYGGGAFRFRREQVLRGRSVPLEPSFYLRTLPLQAVQGRSVREAAAQLALLVPWHLANAAGFVWHWMRSHREQPLESRG